MAPQTRIAVHTVGQKRCVWRPKMVVFETHHAKNVGRVQGWRPKHAYLCTLWARKGVSGYLKWWCLKCTMPTNVVWVVGWRPKHAYLCTPWATKGVFGYLQWWCLKRTMPKKHGVGSGVAPQTRMPVHTVAQKSYVWIPQMVVVETHHAKKVWCGCLGGAPNTHTSAHHGREKVCLGT